MSYGNAPFTEALSFYVSCVSKAQTISHVRGKILSYYAADVVFPHYAGPNAHVCHLITPKSVIDHAQTT
jgi:hypothetical protein